MTNQIRTLDQMGVRFERFPVGNEDRLKSALLRFIDTGGTSTNRSTAYNTKEQQSEAMKILHKDLYSIDRGIYTAALMMPGHTDNTIVTGVENLLSNQPGHTESMLEFDAETKAIALVLSRVSIPRVLKLFVKMKEDRVNNARTRRVILLTLFGTDKLPFWSIKYKRKMGEILEHAWNKRMSGIIRNIVNGRTSIEKRTSLTRKEQGILRDHIGRYAKDVGIAYESVAFIFGLNYPFKHELFKSYIEAKTDITKGSKLPSEVLEGIRSTHHKDTVTPAEVLELTKKNLSGRQAMKVQESAKRKDVKVEFDAMKQNVVDLYLYAYKLGELTGDIREALQRKAKSAAKSSVFQYNKLAIVFDATESSRGDKTQPLRPMAIAMSVRDMLLNIGEEQHLFYCGGKRDGDLVHPMGETNLARPFIDALKKDPDAIVIISDGYENAPAGRLAEVIRGARKIGINIPIYHFNPVMSAEAGGVRVLSEEASTMPISSPDSLGMGMVKALIEADVQNGVRALFNTTVPQLAEVNI